jgi:polyisoprenoid-binding protein YceI
MTGVTRPVEVDLTFEVTPGILHVRGGFTVRQTDFGIHPYSAGLGTVKVKNEVTFTLDIRALASR